MSSPVSILFVSTRDSLRSVLAASCLAHLARGKFHVSSCGEVGAIARQRHPAALQALAQAQIPALPGEPRDWSPIVQRMVRAPEVVIVLDAGLAGRVPSWPAQPDTAVWALPDLLSGPSQPRPEEVLTLLHGLRRRLDILSNLPMRDIDRGLLRSDLRDLGYA